MLDVVKRMRQAVDDAKLTYAQLEKITGISDSSLQRYLTGKTNKIPLPALQKIADATGVSAAYIMGWEDEDDKTPAPNITEDYTTFPVIGEIAAGYEHIAIEDWEGETVNIPNDYLKGRCPDDFFVLRVKGDSMFPAYQDGDKVLVLKQSTLNYSGQVGVVLYNGEYGTLKKVEYVQGEDWMQLVPINPSHPPVRIEGIDLEQCRILGIPKLLIREINN